MQSETKQCQNCKNDFLIEPDDFSFYEKIKVPSPTFCPECRMIRRMTWRNHRSLYKRNCYLCNKTVISMYNDEAPVCCTECWGSDGRNQFEVRLEYDFLKPFFIQFLILIKKAPRLYSYKIGNLINSDFTNYSLDNKNVYLSYSVIECEDTMYSESVDKSKKIFDCLNSIKLENCSYNIDCDGNYNTHYAIKSRNCIDCYFVYDCVNCQNCFLSANLRNKKYYFKNQQLTKEEYEKKIQEVKLGTYSGISLLKNDFDLVIKDKKTIHKFAKINNSINASGDDIGNSRNVKYGFNVQDSEDIKYSWRVLAHNKDGMDLQGVTSGELIYEAIAVSYYSYKTLFCYIGVGCRECEYCFYIKNCSNCFGCSGLTNASYCIFNKQYKEEDYFLMLEKIKKHMIDIPYIDSKGRVGRYGEFFPSEMSPFGYNETNAQDFFTLSRGEAISKGYLWKEKEKSNYNILIQSEKLPDDIKKVEDTILSEIIGCPNNGDQQYQCATAYRITPEELQFYKQKNLPLPRYCPNCRHYQRLKYTNSLKLWHRTCMHKGCANEFETSYSPERSEVIYCEKCYQQEVY